MANSTTPIQLMIFKETHIPVYTRDTFLNLAIFSVVSGGHAKELCPQYFEPIPYLKRIHFCHWAEDSDRGPEAPKVIYNLIAIYGMMIINSEYSLTLVWLLI